METVDMDDQVSVRSWDCVRQQLTAESELVVTPKQKKNKFRLDGSDDCSTPPTEYRKFSAFKSAEVDREEEGERRNLLEELREVKAKIERAKSNKVQLREMYKERERWDPLKEKRHLSFNHLRQEYVRYDISGTQDEVTSMMSIPVSGCWSDGRSSGRTSPANMTSWWS